MPSLSTEGISSLLLALTGRDQSSAEASTKRVKVPIPAERFVLPVEAAVFGKDPWPGLCLLRAVVGVLMVAFEALCG